MFTLEGVGLPVSCLFCPADWERSPQLLPRTGAARKFDQRVKMIKKALTCAAIVAAAFAVGTSSAAANGCDMSNNGHAYAAEWSGGKFDVIRTSTGAGIYSGSGHQGGVCATHH
jgi:hypothetical protein